MMVFRATQWARRRDLLTLLPILEHSTKWKKCFSTFFSILLGHYHEFQSLTKFPFPAMGNLSRLTGPRLLLLLPITFTLSSFPQRKRLVFVFPMGPLGLISDEEAGCKEVRSGTIRAALLLHTP